MSRPHQAAQPSSAEALLADFCEASGTHFVEVYRPSAKTRQMVSNPIRRDDLLMLIHAARGIDSPEVGETRSGSTAKPQEPGARQGTRPEDAAQQAAQVQEPLSDDDTATLAEQHGAQVGWAAVDDMHHIIKFTPPELRAFCAAWGVQLTKEGGNA